MPKIVAKSRYGFKLDSLKNDWEKVDKSLLHRELFNSLEKGFQIDIKERNKKGFILDFKVINHDNPEASKNNVPNTVSKQLNSDCSLTPSDIKATDRDRNILKGQCLNIAFKDIDVTDSNFRDRGIKIAQKLFVELEEANFYGW